MDKKIRSSIIKSNKSIWDKQSYKKIAKKGLYEVYFIIFYNEQRKESYWIRYSLVCNKKVNFKSKEPINKMNGQGLLWFGYFSYQQSQRNFMSKKHFSLAEVQGTQTINDNYVFITINNSFLSLTNAKGDFITKSGKKYSWDLTFSNFQKSYSIVPKLAKMLKLTNTMNKATHPHIDISGTLEINGEKLTIASFPAIQYHTYADGYKQPWEWFSCYTIPNWSRGFIDFSYKGNKGILDVHNGKNSLTPWNNNIFKKLSTSKLLKRDHSSTSLQFKLKKGKLTISGNIRVNEDQIIGVEYLGPRGEKFYCYNSEIADGLFKIRRSTNDTIEISIIGSVAFETTYREPIQGIAYLRWEDEELF